MIFSDDNSPGGLAADLEKFAPENWRGTKELMGDNFQLICRALRAYSAKCTLCESARANEAQAIAAWLTRHAQGLHPESQTRQAICRAAQAISDGAHRECTSYQARRASP